MHRCEPSHEPPHVNETVDHSRPTTTSDNPTQRVDAAPFLSQIAAPSPTATVFFSPNAVAAPSPTISTERPDQGALSNTPSTTLTPAPTPTVFLVPPTSTPTVFLTTSPPTKMAVTQTPAITNSNQAKPLATASSGSDAYAHTMIALIVVGAVVIVALLVVAAVMERRIRRQSRSTDEQDDDSFYQETQAVPEVTSPGAPLDVRVDSNQTRRASL